LIQRAVADVAADLGRDVPLDATAAATVTEQIGARVKDVISTQRDRLATLVNTYDGNPDALKAALQEALDTSELRAGVIAKTETRHVVNQGRVLGMESAGLKQTLVFDGDEDDACASVNNTRQTLAWALANPLGHPNCQRSFEVIEED